MSRNVIRKGKSATDVFSATVSEYLAALHEAYPAANGMARVVAGPKGRILITIPLPTRPRERMKLFDQMSEVGTRLLLDSNQYIILSGR